MRYTVSLILATLGLFACSGAHADFRADFSAVKGNRSHDLSRIELSGTHMRTDAGNYSMLFDAASGKMLMLQHDRKQYMDMQHVAHTANAAMARAKAALANLPPAQREMIEKRLGGRMPGMMGGNVSVNVVSTGKHEQVGKFSCDVYRTTVNGRRIQDACLAEAGATGISAADQGTLRKVFAQLKAMASRMSAGMVKSPLSGMPKGRFPVQITEYDRSGAVRSEVQLQQVSRGTLPASDFRIPSNYTERKMGH